MPDFYEEVLRDLTRDAIMHPGMRILVVCGGAYDSRVLQKCGFTDVVISNVGTKPARSPHEWARQDAENLSYADESFDFCVVHSGLHHCHSPHRALLEMYRVARAGVLLFEPYDNLLTRVGVRLNVGQRYEHASIHTNHKHAGGVGNTTVPNFVYRFTQQEIVKAVQTYAPYAEHEFRFFHRMRIPWGQLKNRRNRAFYYAVRAAQPALKVVETVLPKQSNNFAALIRKPDLGASLHPWLRRDEDGIHLREDWVAARYGR